MWLDAWISPKVPIRVPFPMDAAAARARLQQSLDHWKSPATSHRERWHFVGEVLVRKVKVSAAWGFGGPAGASLNGVIVETDSGRSEFVGHFGRTVRPRTAVAGLVLVVITFWLLAPGVEPGDRGWLNRTLATLPYAGVTLTVASFRMNRWRKESGHGTTEDALRHWLTGLAAGDPGVQ